MPVCVCVYVRMGVEAVAIRLVVISCCAFIMNEILYGTTTLCAGVPRCACGYLKMVSAHKFPASSAYSITPPQTHTHTHTPQSVSLCVCRLVWMKSSVPWGNNAATGSLCCPHRVAFYAFLKCLAHPTPHLSIFLAYFLSLPVFSLSLPPLVLSL